MLWCDGKYSNNSRIATSLTATTKDKPKCRCCEYRNERKKSCLPSEHLRYTGISTKISLPLLPTLTWYLGGVDPGSIPSNHSGALHLSSPGLPLTSHQVFNHYFSPWLRISTTTIFSWFKSISCSLALWYYWWQQHILIKKFPWEFWYIFVLKTKKKRFCKHNLSFLLLKPQMRKIFSDTKKEDGVLILIS